MGCCLDVFIPGTDEGAPAHPVGGASVRFVSGPNAPVDGAEAEIWNRMVRNCEADLFAFVDGRAVPSLGTLQSVCSSHDDEPFAAALLFSVNSSNALIEIWNRYPARLASLIQHPGSGAVAVISKSALEQIGEFTECAAPVWDWLIRATKEGKRIETVQGDMPASPSADNNDALPLLRPEAPGRNKQWLKSHLLGLRPDELVRSVRSDVDFVALTAGLFQWHGFLDESHKASQSIEGRGEHAAGDYWHAIMHRRELDYSNAKYWFRRVGGHPIFERLARQASAILDASPSDDASAWKSRLTPTGDWDPFAFVDLCETCAADENAELAQAARRIQWAEMRLLLEQTYADATG